MKGPLDGTLVVDFADLDRASIPIAGGKGAHLGEMMRAGLPVPPGFVVTLAAYERMRKSSGLGSRMDALLRTVTVDDPSALQRVSAALRDTLTSAVMSEELSRAMDQAYVRLAASTPGGGQPLVAVRASASAEDTTEFSFSGMFASTLGVRGRPALMDAVRRCWASTFGPRALFYRLSRQMPVEMPVAVVVQRMVQAEASGVLFTADPETGASDRIVIEAAWGLGEVVVARHVTSDRYVMEKRTGLLIERKAGEKAFMVEALPNGGTRRVQLTGDARANALVLSDPHLAQLLRYALASESHFGIPQDMEFASAGADVFITQTRPLTTLARTGSVVTSAPADDTAVSRDARLAPPS